MAADALASGPLTGLRAIEFGQLLAGPFVGTLLGDFGADVIKVEAPPAGDPMREWGRLRHNDHSLWWSVISRNKRSVALNLREPRGQEIAGELCASADVIVENFRPGTMERWGLGPEQVHAVNPGCIYARVSGYGQSGSYRDRAGFAAGGEAIAGLRYINGYPDQAPPRSGISLGDTLAAQSAFQGILLALYARDVRGATGQVVDASITDACLAITESAVLEYEKTGTVRNPTGTRLPRIALPPATTRPPTVSRYEHTRWCLGRPARLPSKDSTVRLPQRASIADGWSALEQQQQSNDRGEPNKRRDQREPVEVALDHRRSGEARGEAATKHVGQAAALAAMQQDQDDEQQARHRDDDL
jgi:crotonobetainyl-CoA:carnitine CoA-transferase CaiB-like acyl-CoA transferase